MLNRLENKPFRTIAEKWSEGPECLKSPLLYQLSYALLCNQILWRAAWFGERHEFSIAETVEHAGLGHLAATFIRWCAIGAGNTLLTNRSPSCVYSFFSTPSSSAASARKSLSSGSSLLPFSINCTALANDWRALAFSPGCQWFMARKSRVAGWF